MTVKELIEKLSDDEVIDQDAEVFCYIEGCLSKRLPAALNSLHQVMHIDGTTALMLEALDEE